MKTIIIGKICRLFVALITICFISQNAHAQEKMISVAEYESQSIALYKEIRTLKKNGLLNNDCGIGACAPPEVKSWFEKWDKLNGTRCHNGFPILQTTDGDSISLGDLYEVLMGAYSDRGKAAMYKFESAMICYENPQLCIKYQKL